VLADPDVLGFRRGYYDLLVGLLWREPAPALVASLVQGLDERIRAARALDPRLAEGWEIVRRFFATVSASPAEAVADEYTRLFIGPTPPDLNLYESFYLTGRLFDQPLAVLRATLRELGIEKEPAYSEPEDFLAFELEVMRVLLRRQAGAPDPDTQAQVLSSQGTFLKRHLLVWGPAAARDLGDREDAPFYRGVGHLLQGFLALEKEHVSAWGPEELRTLDAMRQLYGRRPVWRGPLFEAGADRPGDPGGGRPGHR
jgi:TorA maturation chaperone TorD